jgi:8-oxo-dGTP pyrophosphatase MutT (NUDIX family)
MSRENVLALLDAYRPFEESDARARERILDFVRQNPRCFERELEIGHVTGSAWLVDPQGERVLLTHHRKLDRWLQLGGHADGDADILWVALREAQEESGLSEIEPIDAAIFDVDVHEIPARSGEPAHLHYDVRFAMRAKTPEIFQASPESKALAWIPITALERYTHERSMLRMRDKWLARTTDCGL